MKRALTRQKSPRRLAQRIWYWGAAIIMVELIVFAGLILAHM